MRKNTDKLLKCNFRKKLSNVYDDKDLYIMTRNKWKLVAWAKFESTELLRKKCSRQKLLLFLFETYKRQF